jgi:carboxymethylenebutenolidase
MVDMESNTTLVQSYPAHQAVPGGDGPFPAALVLHDRLGLTTHVRHVTNRLAHSGFYALAPDLYGLPSIFSVHEPDSTRAPHRTYFDWSEEVEAREKERALTDERALEIVEQAIVYSGGRAKAKSGGVRILGFGAGGRLAFLAACRFPESVRALSLFAPCDLNVPKPPGASRPSPLDEADKLRAPVLLLYGKLDTTIPRGETAAAVLRLQSLGKSVHVEMLRAGPDFFCEERDSYRIGASKIVWDETLKLFRET